MNRGWNPNARGVIPKTPDPKLLPGALGKLAAELAEHVEVGAEIRRRANQLAQSKNRVAKTYEAELADAIRAGRERPENPIPDLGDEIADCLHEAEARQIAAAATAADFGAAAVKVQAVQARKMAARSATLTAEIGQQVEALRTKAAELNEAERLLDFWVGIDSLNPGFRSTGGSVLDVHLNGIGSILASRGAVDLADEIEMAS
jgi:hypothetical protein